MSFNNSTDGFAVTLRNDFTPSLETVTQETVTQETVPQSVLKQPEQKSRFQSLFSIPSLMRFNRNKRENGGPSAKKVLFILITLILVIAIAVLAFVEIPENMKMVVFVISSILGLCSFAILLDKKIQ